MTEMPDIHSPEFRSILFSHFMMVADQARATQIAHDLITKLDFKDVTPEKWAVIQALMPALATTSEYVLVSIKSLDLFVDDVESMDRVKEHVLKAMAKEQEDG